MSDSPDKLRGLTGLLDFANRRQTALAQGSFRAIDDIIVALGLGRDAETFLDLHRRNEASVVEHLKTLTRLCHVVRFVYYRLGSVVTGPDDTNDPTIQADAASLLTHLLSEYPSRLPEEHRQVAYNALQGMLRTAVERRAEAVQPQIDVLCSTIREIIRFIDLLHLDGARIVLPELPVGNSIPVKLLCDALERRGYSVIVVRAALSRNDAAQRGITRQRLLWQSLEQAHLQGNDVLLYLDEWLTGTNFCAISRILEKFVKRAGNLHLLPVGLLRNTASAHPRFERDFVPVHDRMCHKFGQPGARFRFVLPPIVSNFPTNEYFFWSELDRISGYRKMQFLGTVFSSLDAAVETIHDQADERLRAQFLLVQHLAIQAGDNQDQQRLIGTMVKDKQLFSELFESSYNDYQNVRQQLLDIEHGSNIGEIEDPDTAMDEVTHLVNVAVNDRPAQLCVWMALRYISDSPQLDPHNRYYFKQHAPVIFELTGEHVLLHQYWMDILLRHLQSIMDR